MPPMIFEHAQLISAVGGILIGVVLIGIALYYIMRMSESENWPQVEGEIVASNVETRKRVIRASDHLWPRMRVGIFVTSSHREIYEYTPKVRYRYTVQGKEYRGERIGIFQRTYNHEDEAQNVCWDYPAGETFPVYYDPRRPERSVLESGVKLGGLLVYLLVGVVFIVMGVFGLLALE